MYNLTFNVVEEYDIIVIVFITARIFFRSVGARMENVQKEKGLEIYFGKYATEYSSLHIDVEKAMDSDFARKQQSWNSTHRVKVFFLSTHVRNVNNVYNMH